MTPCPSSSASGKKSWLQTEILSALHHVDGPPTIPLTANAIHAKRQADLRTASWPQLRGYEILSVIGSGGMGIVYKARQRDLNRIVAIKMIRGSGLDDPEIRDRFQAEAESVAKLQHPNIIQVFEIGTIESPLSECNWHPFISIEFVDGGSLEQRIGTPQTPEYAARMVEKLARATHAAHRVGVIHRDLKPANVLLTATGEPKIADFGVAKQIDVCEKNSRLVTQAGIVVGTPQYMAPEQVECKAVTAAIDIYALGVILYELLTARLPFQSDTPLRTLEMVLDQEPVSPRLLRPELPRDLETICLKCLEKAPERRYATAEALADDLARWQSGKLIHARPIGVVEHGMRWVKRNPAVAALSALVVMVALTGLAGVLWKWREAHTNADAANLAAGLAEERAALERWERYRSGILAASSALQVHNAAAARRALDAAPAEYRNWEWRYLDRQLDVSEAIFFGANPDDPKYFTSTNGLQIVEHTANAQWRIWDANARQLSHSWQEDPSWCGRVLSDDGKLLAFALQDKSIRVRNLVSGESLAMPWDHEQAPSTIRFSPDGVKLATGAHDGTTGIWDTATGKQLLVLVGLRGPVVDVAFSPNKQWIATAGAHDCSARLWNATTGELTATLDGHQAAVTSVHFSPDGKRLLSVEVHPSYRLRLWDSATGRSIAVMEGHANRVLDVAFSPDGARIVSTGHDQTIRLWDGVTGKPLHTMRGHNGWVTRARFSPDGSQLASASLDHTIRLWDVRTGIFLASLNGHTGAVHNVAYLADGTTLVSNSADGSIRYWDLNALRRDGQLQGHTSFVYGVALHPDGKQVASASWDGTVRIWDGDSGREIRSLVHPKQTIATAVAYHPKGQFIASMGRENAVYLWDPSTGELVHQWYMPTHAFLEARLAFNPQGSLLASGCENGTVRLWDVYTKAEVAVLHGHRGVIRDVAFSPDGRWLASGADCNDRTIRIWDVANKTQLRVLEGHLDRVNTLTFSADGKLLASGSTDGTARLWDPVTGKQLAVLKHESKVYGLAFTPDGTRLATACADNTIRLWAVATYQEVAELRGHTDYVHAIAFTRDGTRLVSSSGDLTLRTWDTLRSHSHQWK
jgi:WD40 repeat protein/tRNA A-37 threonylcarbamoyl transferase component Bud32